MAAAAALVILLALGSGVARAATCDPLTTKPIYDRDVPTTQDVLGVILGRKELSVDQVYTYMDALDAASDRIVTGTYGTSVDGRPLRYAVVSNPANLSLDRAQPGSARTPRRCATRSSTPTRRPPSRRDCRRPQHRRERPRQRAVRHRGRPCARLYELAARDDCAATQVLRQLRDAPDPDPEPGRPRGRHPPQLATGST